MRTGEQDVKAEVVHDRDVFDAAGLTDARWAGQPQILREQGVADIARSRDVPLQDWSLRSETFGVDLERLVRSGVCLDDAAEWCRAWRGGMDSMTFSCAMMAQDIAEMGLIWPQMTLRDAVGWMLLGGSSETKVDPRDLACRWGLPPLAEGWRYDAAGLTWEETVDRFTVGTVDPDALRVLAALRSARFPAGTFPDEV